MDIVFYADDYDTVLAEAIRLGFVDPEDNTQIVTSGSFVSGGGWFLNLTGEIFDESSPPAKRPGFWGRLRLKGSPETMPSFSGAITQYVWSDDLEGWTADGLTLAPSWVANISVIA